MKKLLCAMMLILGACPSLNASVCFSLCDFIPDEVPVGFRVGYRHDNLLIRNTFEGNDLHVVKKIEWSNIQSYLFGLNAVTYTPCNIFLKGRFDYGRIVSADLKIDSRDFQLDDFKQESAVHGRTYDAEIAIGYPVWLDCWCEGFHFIPLLGYSCDKIEFEGHGRVLSTNQKIKPHHHTNWRTPFVGIDLELPFCCSWRLHAGYEYHWGNYHSNATLSEHRHEDFSYHLRQKGRGEGQKADIGLGYEFCSGFESYLSASYAHWYANNGHEQTQFRRRSHRGHNHHYRFDSHVKDYEWETWSARFDIVYYY